MFLICADAPATIARESIGYFALTMACSATAVFLVAAPIQRLPLSRSSIAVESLVTSTSTDGRSIVSRIRSTRFVPPPRYLLPASPA